MVINTATILCTSVSQYPQHGQPILFKIQQYFVVKYVRRGNGSLGCIELAECYLAVSIYKGLLIETAHALEVADIEGVLGPQVTWMSSFNFTTSLIIMLFLF